MKKKALRFRIFRNSLGTAAGAFAISTFVPPFIPYYTSPILEEHSNLYNKRDAFVEYIEKNKTENPEFYMPEFDQIRLGSLNQKIENFEEGDLYNSEKTKRNLLARGRDWGIATSGSGMILSMIMAFIFGGIRNRYENDIDRRRQKKKPKKEPE